MVVRETVCHTSWKLENRDSLEFIPESKWMMIFQEVVYKFPVPSASFRSSICLLSAAVSLTSYGVSKSTCLTYLCLHLSLDCRNYGVLILVSFLMLTAVLTMFTIIPHSYYTATRWSWTWRTTPQQRLLSMIPSPIDKMRNELVTQTTVIHLCLKQYYILNNLYLGSC